MKKTMLRVAAMAAALLLAAGCASSSGSSSTGAETKTVNYPTKTIKMIVPYGAGGTTDVVGRKLAAVLEQELGQSITVINQAGASGSVGTKTVFDEKNDGYTLLFSADSLGTQRVMGLSDFSYDDFSPILLTADDPKVIVVAKNSKYQTLEDLLADMKARPGKVKMSYTGPGGSGHVQSLIYSKLGYDASLTAYSSGSECILAVMGDQVDFTNSNLSTVKGYIESGDMRLLAVSTPERLPLYPDAATFTEIMPESEKYMKMPFTPLSLLVKNDVPEEVQKVLREAAQKAVATEDWNGFADENCLQKLYEAYPTAEDTTAFYKEWESMISWLLYDAGAAKFSPEKFSIAKIEG